jgi:serine/threonine protein kinase
MKTQRQCGQCGKPLPEGADDADCPTCLLEWGMGTSTDDSTTVVGATEPSPVGAPALGQTEHFRRLPYFGDYELLDEIARGGMGVVYRARQVSLNRTVAVKMILAAQFAGKDAIQRFKTEAEAVAHLRHPHVVGIHEVGEHEGFHCFSMDYVEGKVSGRRSGRSPLLPGAPPSGSRPSPRPSTTRTSKASCIATSSPRTS